MPPLHTKACPEPSPAILPVVYRSVQHSIGFLYNYFKFKICWLMWRLRGGKLSNAFSATEGADGNAPAVQSHASL